MKKHSILGLSTRTIIRWRHQSGAQNRRKGPLTAPADKLSEQEQEQLSKIGSHMLILSCNFDRENQGRRNWGDFTA
jgi:hypothetical protein